VDFVPYEGAPLKGGRDLKGLILALAIGAAMLVGTWALAASAQSSITTSVVTVMMSAPSTMVVDNVAVSDSDFGPGEAESEVALLPIAAR
jgi:hypothetical protein